MDPIQLATYYYQRIQWGWSVGGLGANSAGTQQAGFPKAPEADDGDNDNGNGNAGSGTQQNAAASRNAGAGAGDSVGDYIRSLQDVGYYNTWPMFEALQGNPTTGTTNNATSGDSQNLTNLTNSYIAELQVLADASIFASPGGYLSLSAVDNTTAGLLPVLLETGGASGAASAANFLQDEMQLSLQYNVLGSLVLNSIGTPSLFSTIV